MTQTNYNKRLDEILDSLKVGGLYGDRGDSHDRALYEAKSALTQLFKDVVAGAKLDWHQHLEDGECPCYMEGGDQFQQNILKVLGEESNAK